MRILHLNMLYPPEIHGGAERSVAMLAEALASLGHHVGAACIAREAVPRTDRNGVAVYRMPHETDFWPLDWPTHSRPERFLAKFKQQFNFAIERRFAAVLDDFKPDLVHSHSLLDVSTLTWRAAKARGIPIVHTLRDYSLLCTNASLFQDGKRCASRHLKCRINTVAKGRHQRLVDGVAAVGRETLDIHLAHGMFAHVPKVDRRVIWNPAIVDGIESGYVRPARTGPFTFGYLGRINTEKGVETMLRACRRLEGPDWRLLIAGKANNDVRPFEELAAGLPVTFGGFMEPKTFFESVDVLIVPSIWPEPLPRTILESYAAGVPVIGARSGGIPELIDDEGPDTTWLFTPDDDEALALRMNQLLAAGRDRLPGLDRHAEVLRNTRPEIVAERYLQLYHDTTARVRGRQPS